METYNNFVNQCKEKGKKEKELLKKKTKINPYYIFGFIGAAAIFSLFGLFDKPLTLIVGTALPVFWTYKAIESKEEDDDKQWLTYWGIFAIFSFLDLFARFILKIVPLYYFLKLVFLVWCYWPSTKGAQIIYDKFIGKLFKKYEKTFDKAAQKVLEKTGDYANQAKKAINENKGKILSKGMEAASAASDLINN